MRAHVERERTTRPRKKAEPIVPAPRELLDATPSPDLVEVPAYAAVAVEGQGAPESDAFQQAIGAMFAAAYTLKFVRKHAGAADFKIGPLEARWWVDERGVMLPDVPRDRWCWRLRIPVPASVTAAELKRAIAAAAARKEASPALPRVFLEKIRATRYGRVLHVGPYGDETRSFARIRELLETAGLAPAGPHVEVYLSDPRRTKPEKLRTAILLEL